MILSILLLQLAVRFVPIRWWFPVALTAPHRVLFRLRTLPSVSAATTAGFTDMWIIRFYTHFLPSKRGQLMQSYIPCYEHAPLWYLLEYSELCFIYVFNSLAKVECLKTTYRRRYCPHSKLTFLFRWCFANDVKIIIFKGLDFHTREDFSLSMTQRPVYLMEKSGYYYSGSHCVQLLWLPFLYSPW